MIFPYNTDVPLYYRPIGTVILIFANLVAFTFELNASIDEIVPWILQLGDGLHPAQWVTMNFLHADFMHLAGNMVFLWSFGLVVEGKIGWKLATKWPRPTATSCKQGISLRSSNRCTRAGGGPIPSHTFASWPSAYQSDRIP